MRTVHVDLHAALTARAASEGLTLSEYILAQLRGLAYESSNGDVLARVRARSAVGGASAAEVIRAERDDR